MKNNFNNTTYNSSFKENAVQQLLMPNSLGLSATASKIGIPHQLFTVGKKNMLIF